MNESSRMSWSKSPSAEHVKDKKGPTGYERYLGVENSMSSIFFSFLMSSVRSELCSILRQNLSHVPSFCFLSHFVMLTALSSVIFPYSNMWPSLYECATIASYQVPESLLLRDLIYVFQGIDGRFIKFNDEKQEYRVERQVCILSPFKRIALDCLIFVPDWCTATYARFDP